jgi:hypothetical protein
MRLPYRLSIDKLRPVEYVERQRSDDLPLVATRGPSISSLSLSKKVQCPEALIISSKTCKLLRLRVINAQKISTDRARDSIRMILSFLFVVRTSCS